MKGAVLRVRDAGENSGMASNDGVNNIDPRHARVKDIAIGDGVAGIP